MHVDAMITSHPQMRGQMKSEFVRCIEVFSIARKPVSPARTRAWAKMI